MSQILPQHIPQGLGLLRTEKDTVLVADGDLVRESLEARPKINWKSQTLTRIWTLLA